MKHYIRIADKLLVCETEDEREIHKLWHEIESKLIAAAQDDPGFKATTLDRIPDKYWKQIGLPNVTIVTPYQVENVFIETKKMEQLGVTFATCEDCSHYENGYCCHYGESHDCADNTSDCEHFSSYDARIYELRYQDDLLERCRFEDDEDLPWSYEVYEAIKDQIEAIEKPEDMSDQVFRNLFHYDDDDDWKEWLEKGDL